MKVLLVDNLVMPDDGSLDMLDVHPHLGLLALAAVAEAAGHTVEIYDPKRLIKFGRLAYDNTLYERAAAELLAEQADVIGFTALGCSFLFSLNVAGLIKRREPDLPVLLGGPHATMLHRQILNGSISSISLCATKLMKPSRRARQLRENDSEKIPGRLA